MGNRKKTTPKAKEPVKIRYKRLSNGNQSIYLDYYKDGQHDYEFLKLYIVPETSTDAKEANRETLRLANAIKAQKIVEMQNKSHGFSVSAGRLKMNLPDYVKGIAEQKKQKAGGDVPSAWTGYMVLHYHLKRYSGDTTTFKQIDKSYCMGFIEYLKTAKSVRGGHLSENSQAEYMKKFEAVLSAAIADEILTINPFKQIKSENKPKTRPAETRYLTIDEVKALEKMEYVIYPNIKNAFLFACYTGLRFSDIAALTWDKLQKDNEGRMFINYVQKKTQKQEYLPIGDKAVQFLPDKRGAKDKGKVFKLPTGGYVNLNLKQWGILAGIRKRLTFHVARHTYATMLLSAGASIEVTSKMLGHADIKTTQVYAKIVDEKKRAAVDLLDGLTD